MQPGYKMYAWASHMENKVNVFHVCMYVLYDRITIVNVFDYS